MTTVRGKRPVKMRGGWEIEARHYSLEIYIRASATDDTGHWFNVEATIDPEQAIYLIRKLRQALRKLRDETTQRLNNAVLRAEGSVDG